MTPHDMEPILQRITAHHIASQRTGHQLRLLLDLLFRVPTGAAREIRSTLAPFRSPAVVGVVGRHMRHERHRLSGVQNFRLKE